MGGAPLLIKAYGPPVGGVRYTRGANNGTPGSVPGHPGLGPKYLEAKWERVRYQILVEYDAEGKVFLASVLGLSVHVQAQTEREALKLAKEGLHLYLEETTRRRRLAPPGRPVKGKLVTVDV